MRWQEKLTKKEMKHLQRNCQGRPTLAGLRRDRKHQATLKRETGVEPCWVCRFIAHKLGLE